ncbi:MAG: PD-(D/E)XK nuclease family protein, partial [Bryobacterales bacterium]|nr:PD-(D/E)XK nuclease family protein [Bryobacterales bacterium]
MLLFSSGDAFAGHPIDLFGRYPGCCLLTPTATMAEHLRHRMARQGMLVRPDAVVTLSRFIEPWVADLPQVPPAALQWLVREVLHHHAPAEFQGLRDAPGLRNLLASLIEELSTAGCSPELVEGIASPGVQAVYDQVAGALRERGWYLRSQRLHIAAHRMRHGTHRFHAFALLGFYSFTPAEADVIDALLSHPLAIGLEESDAASETVDKLLAMGLSYQRIEEPVPSPSRTVVSAPSVSSEADEIARRILLEAGNGRPYREIGVILRRERPYAPLLAAALRRYRIPARFYFQQRLRHHPLIAHLLAILDAAAEGWDYDALRRLIASNHSGFGASPSGDQLSYWLLSHSPAHGLPHLLSRFERIADWPGSRKTAAEWQSAFASLPGNAVLPALTDGVSQEQVLEWRRIAGAVNGWNQALAETTALISSLHPSEAISFAAFRECLATVLDETSLEAPDQRRDVVHVIDAYEARQWQLPVVFICGLTERHFPQYHSEHPLLGDTAREELRRTGHILRTSQERQHEERFLFQVGCRTAGEKLFLTYPEANERGDENLRSFLLNNGDASRVERAIAVRPRPAMTKPLRRPVRITSKEILSLLRKGRNALSPTSIETFLQCPYQYFAGHRLRLNAPPQAPRDRLDFLLQGDILHRTLAESEGSPLFVEEIFARLFEDSCREHAVPFTCRTERVRLELLANLRRFLDSPPLKGGRTVGVERSFDLPLGSLRLRGKIDRVVELPQRGLVVIDYKYSTRIRIRDRVRSHERGELVQGGLYLWAAEKLFRQQPAGMLYCGLRGEVAWDGWHIPVFGWQDI